MLKKERGFEQNLRFNMFQNALFWLKSYKNRQKLGIRPQILYCFRL